MAARRQVARASEGRSQPGIVVDASVVLAAEDPRDPQFAPAGAELARSEPLATVDVCAWEVANVAVTKWRDAATARDHVLGVEAIADAGNLLTWDEALGRRSIEIAEEHDISVYDAAYVAAGERLGAELVSCDEGDLVAKGLARLPG